MQTSKYYDLHDYQELQQKKIILENEIDWTARQLRECEKKDDYYYMLGGAIKKLEKMIEPLQRGCNTIRDCIASVPDPVQRELLQFRYIDFLHWERIADKMHYSLSHVYELHRGALEAYQAACEADQGAESGQHRTTK